MPGPVRSLSYNRLEGYIACGGDNGVLKAVKLDSKNGNMVHFYQVGLYNFLVWHISSLVAFFHSILLLIVASCILLIMNFIFHVL